GGGERPSERNVLGAHRDVPGPRRRRGGDRHQDDDCEEELLHRRSPDRDTNLPDGRFALKVTPPLANTIPTPELLPSWARSRWELRSLQRRPERLGLRPLIAFSRSTTTPTSTR